MLTSSAAIAVLGEGIRLTLRFLSSTTSLGIVFNNGQLPCRNQRRRARCQHEIRQQSSGSTGSGAAFLAPLSRSHSSPPPYWLSSLARTSLYHTKHIAIILGADWTRFSLKGALLCDTSVRRRWLREICDKWLKMIRCSQVKVTCATKHMAVTNTAL